MQRIEPISEFVGMTREQIIEDGLYYRRVGNRAKTMESRKLWRGWALKYIMEANAGVKP